MSSVVISAPVSNRPTRISGQAGRMLYWTIKSRYPNTKVYWIPGNLSIHDRAGVLQKLAAHDTVLFAYYGHGKRDRICGSIPPHCSTGHGGFVDERNVAVLDNIIVFSVACWTAVKLGRDAEATGARSYIGLRKPCYVAFPHSERRYDLDIIDVWNTFPTEMISGKTVGQAIREMSEKSRKYEKYYNEHSDKLLYGEYYFRRFKSNRTALVPFGDLRATLN